MPNEFTTNQASLPNYLYLYQVSCLLSNTYFHDIGQRNIKLIGNTDHGAESEPVFYIGAHKPDFIYKRVLLTSKQNALRSLERIPPISKKKIP